MGPLCKKFFCAIAAAVILTWPLAVLAQEPSSDYGLGETAGKTRLSQMGISANTPEGLAEQIVQTVLFFVGTIFFALMLYAGITWMIARGETEKVSTAKAILETAIIGLAITSASYAAANFIFAKLTAPPEAPAAEERGLLPQ